MSIFERFSDKGAANPEPATHLKPLFLDTCVYVREVLKVDLETCEKPREQVAEELSELTGCKWSVPQLDKWVAESAPHRFPAELMPAWCYVTGSRRIFEVLAEKVYLFVGTGDDRDFAELGRCRIKDEQLTRRLWSKL